MPMKQFPSHALALGVISCTWLAACAPDSSLGPDAVVGGRDSGGAAGASGALSSLGGASSGSASTDSAGSVSMTAAGSSGSTTESVAGASGAAPVAGASGMTGGAGAANGGAAMGGASSTGPVVAGGESKCAALSGAKNCDGFEGAGLGATGNIWSALASGGNTVVVDTSKPFRGSKGVHITFLGASASNGFITETQTFSATATSGTNNAMWARAFVWYQLNAGETPPAGHFVFIRHEGTAQAGRAASSNQLHLLGGHGAQLAAEIRDPGDIYNYTSPVLSVPQAKPGWQCWEWRTGADNTASFYVDGKEVTFAHKSLPAGPAVTTADKWYFPNFNKLYIGWLDFSAGPKGEMWIDEVAISDKQIGCGN